MCDTTHCHVHCIIACKQMHLYHSLTPKHVTEALSDSKRVATVVYIHFCNNVRKCINLTFEDEDHSQMLYVCLLCYKLFILSGS